MLRKSLKAVAALMALLLLAAALYVWRSFPRLDGDMRAPGLASAVLVRRDTSDVTHIEAQSIADAYFALGWVHAQERGWQLEFNRRVMRGELSEVLGAATLETDKLMRTLGIMRSAQAQWQRLPQEAKALLQAYANGINSFHAHAGQALPPEFHILRAGPGTWQPQDTMGWALMMALDLGGNWGNEFARLSALQRIDTPSLWQLMPPYPGEPPATAVDLASLYRSLGVYRNGVPVPVRTSALPSEPSPASGLALVDAAQINDWARHLGQPDGKGSNNWVVAGTHTESGKPLLANDPHLALASPAIWYFARLKAPATAGGKPMDVIGATLPGLPSVVLGRTAGVAWGFTNVGPDVQDLYLEQIDPADPSQYRTPDGWAPFDTRDEIIKVKGRPDVRIVVRSTRHGPVLSDVQASHGEVLDTRKFVLALSWTALDAGNQTVLSGVQSNTAQTVEELMAAFAIHHSPMQNVVAADTRGRTGYQAIGRAPLRRPENDLRGVAPAPGWERKYDWAGEIAADKYPRVGDEAIQSKGWHATANQRIHPAGYPHFLGSDWYTPERFDRIESLLAAKTRHSAVSLREVQGDVLSTAARKLLPLLQATRSTHALAPAALAQVKSFDGVMHADGAAPLIVSVWADELTRGLIEPRLGPDKFRVLYGKRSFRQGLETILDDARSAASWCAPLSCEEQSARALARSLERIAAQQGKDPAAWRWGPWHSALSAHRPFGNVAALAGFFDVAVPTGGDNWTVNVGQYWPNDPRLPFANRHAASMRAIYDLSDPEKSQFIYQTGQSGLVFSPRYRDMKDQWAAVQYRPLRLQPGEWVHQATLTP
ncbi:MAG TPA: penicillin acylase family protein [Ramlibacter sp.]|nr:penicillin acylase family protein [Ramlibacter sp.]